MVKTKAKQLVKILLGMLNRCREHRVSRSAAELTYYLLFTLFPLVIFVYSIIARLNIPIEEILLRLNHIMPMGVSEMLTEYLGYVGGMSRSFMLYVGSLLTVYMLFKAITSLNYAVRLASGQERQKSKSAFLMSIIPSIAMMIIILASLILFSVSRSIYSYIAVVFELSRWVKTVADLVRFAAGPIILFFVLALYYYMIGGKKYRFITVVPGSVFALLIWYVFSLAFVTYVNMFGSYVTLYGSLASIMVLMVWFHTTSASLIMGAELNSVLRELKEAKNDNETADKT